MYCLGSVTIARFEYWPGHLKMLPVTRGVVVILAGFSIFLLFYTMPVQVFNMSLWSKLIFEPVKR